MLNQRSTLDVASVLDGRMWVTLAEFAALTGITRDSAYDRAIRGTLGLPVRQPGGPGTTLRILVSDIRRSMLREAA